MWIDDKAVDDGYSCTKKLWESCTFISLCSSNAFHVLTSHLQIYERFSIAANDA